MSNGWLRRMSWLGVALTVVTVGWFAGTVHSQDDDDDDVPKPVVKAEEPAPNPALQAVGGLGIGHIQSTLGMIGVTADSCAHGVYTGEKVEELMKGVSGNIDAVLKLLRKLQDSDQLADDDKVFLDAMIGTYHALNKEAKALSAFAQTKSAAHSEAFEAARRQAVSKLQQLTSGTNPQGGAPGVSQNRNPDVK